MRLWEGLWSYGKSCEVNGAYWEACEVMKSLVGLIGGRYGYGEILGVMGRIVVS